MHVRPRLFFQRFLLAMHDAAIIDEPTSPATVDKSSARVRKMFGEIAPRYDLLNHLLSMGTDTYWRWRTVRKVALQGTAPVLDLCTGTGDLALSLLALRTREGAHRRGRFLPSDAGPRRCQGTAADWGQARTREF